MNTKIRDLVEVVTPNVPSGSSMSPSDTLSGFLLTYELGDALARIVERVAGNADGV